MNPELLFHIGVGVCAVSAVGLAAAAIALHVAKTRLKKTLDEEYGKRGR